MSGKKKPVAQYDKDGNFIAAYESELEAKRQLNLQPKSSNIGQVCLGKAYESVGYQWRFVTNNIDYKLNIGKSPLKEKLSQGALKGLANRVYESKQIAQYDKQGNLLKVYDSVKEASADTGIHFSNIYRVCKGERKTAGGYIWRDYIKEEK